MKGTEEPKEREKGIVKKDETKDINNKEKKEIPDQKLEDISGGLLVTRIR